MKLTRTHYILIVIGIVLIVGAGVILMSSAGGGKPNLPNDRDADTVLDADDLCPDDPGVAPDGCLPAPAEATAEAS